MASKFQDTAAIIQVVGSVYNNPRLLDDTDKYIITENDFQEQFHKIVFGAIYKLHELGAEVVTIENIADFLEQRPKHNKIFQDNKGEEWILKCSDAAMEHSFDYYYGRLKKFSLLRAYDNCGIDVSYLYDPDNILDIKKKQIQEDYLDNATLDELALKVEEKIDAIRTEYANENYNDSVQAGKGLRELVQRYEEIPEVGIPLYGPLINTVTRGARLKKFYLRSAPSGVGKSRTLVADACYFSCGWIYDDAFGCWIKSGSTQPTLFITTELETEEVQTMMLSFLSGVNEEHILNGKYIGDERQRVERAIEILDKSPLYIEMLPDFSLQDIEDTIKRAIRDHDVKYVALDYIHTSLKILQEISQKSAGMKLREDNVLFMLAIRLKDLCNKYGIFIESATQLNASYQDSETPDQNLLRGAKSIADKIDIGSILLPVKEDDIKALEPILQNNSFETPNIKISVYKNRRGRYKSIYLWCKADLGTCRVKPMFATTWSYNFEPIDDLVIKVEEESAF